MAPANSSTLSASQRAPKGWPAASDQAPDPTKAAIKVNQPYGANLEVPHGEEEA